MDAWLAALREAMPEEEIRAWPDSGDPEEIEVVVTMAPEPGSLRRYRRLRFIAATGAGVDALLDPVREVPTDVPIVKLQDPRLAEDMALYVLAATMRYFRQFHEYEALQERRTWRQLPRPQLSEFAVAVMGLGTLGRCAAGLLAKVGFPVLGWSRTAKALPGVQCFVGPDGLDAMLPNARTLVCLLPLTDATEGMINGSLLSRLPHGAFLINAGRGGHVVEADLLEALETGRLAHATLDVFRAEPLSSEHPFWSHPRITLTPHVASLTEPLSAAQTIAATLRLARLGRPLPGEVDRERGY